jgi:hypothetical protein
LHHLLFAGFDRRIKNQEFREASGSGLASARAGDPRRFLGSEDAGLVFHQIAATRPAPAVSQPVTCPPAFFGYPPIHPQPVGKPGLNI